MRQQIRLPKVLQFPINDICNSRCQMCNIWERKLDSQLSVEEVEKILTNPLFAEVETVGINGGEPTLRKDFPDFTRAVIQSLPGLKGVALITNGYTVPRVTSSINSLGESCREAGVKLDVMVSLDGVGAVHDRVRGREGNFENCVKVLEFVKASPVVDSIRIGCTVIKENVLEVEKLMYWCLDNEVYGRFRLGIPHQRLYNDGFEGFGEFSSDEVYHFCVFLDSLRHNYEENKLRSDFYLSLRNQLAYGFDRAAGCAWRDRGATLSSRGEIAYCAVESEWVGSALENSALELFESNEDHREEILRDKCKSCLHDYEGIPINEAFDFFSLEENPLDQKLPNEEQSFSLLRFFGYLIDGPIDKIVSFLVRRDRGCFRRRARRYYDPLTRRFLLLSGAKNRIRKLDDEVKNALSNSASATCSGDRVLICGWYGTETLGDKAILAGLVSQFGSVKTSSIDVASIEPYVTRMTISQMSELAGCQSISLEEARNGAVEGKYKLVVFGGGPLMSSIGFGWNMRRLFVEVKNNGGRAIIGGCGVGPVDSEISKWSGGRLSGNIWIRHLLELADEILLRDERSCRVAAELTGSKPGAFQQVCDPAFLWLRSVAKRESVGNRERPTLLLGLRDWPIGEYALDWDRKKAEETKASFEREILEFIDLMLKKHPDLLIEPFCMHKLPVGGDDRLFYHRLFRGRPELLRMVDQRHRTPSEDFERFRDADYVVTMRFHSLAFALAAGKFPVVIDYTGGGKVSELARAYSISDRVFELDNFSAEKSVALLEEAPLVELDEESISESRERITVALSV